MSRTNGRKSDKREVKRCLGRARRAMEPRDLQPLERPSHIVVPIRRGTETATAPEPHAPARSDGEHQPRNKTRVQERWESITLLVEELIGRSRKTFAPVAMGRHRGTGALPNRRRQIEYRYGRVRELQPQRSPRHRSVRRGTRTRLRGGEWQKDHPRGKV